MDKSLLMLTDARAAQLAKGLANLKVADPLQMLCDEAAADVARLTTGYMLDPLSVQRFIRALAMYQAYMRAQVPTPADVKGDHESASKELSEIAQGKRPNLPKAATSPVRTNGGRWGSNCKVTGRIPGQI